MKEGDKSPLLEVPTGGKSCKTDEECGFGHCSYLLCVCSAGFTGPDCKAHDVGRLTQAQGDGEASKDIKVERVSLPHSLVVALVALLIGLVLAICWRVRERRGEKVMYSYVRVGDLGLQGVRRAEFAPTDTSTISYQRGTTNRV